MKKEEIIKKINDLIDKRGFSNSVNQNETFMTSSYLMDTNFKLEISNTEPSNELKNYCFKVDSIENIGEIWMEVTKNSNANIDTVLKDAISKFHIDLDKDLFIILKIQ